MVYLTSEDFQKVLQWELIEQFDGTFEEQLRAYEEARSVEGKLPVFLAKERRKFVEQWKFAAENSRRICINIETGEILEPLNN